MTDDLKIVTVPRDLYYHEIAYVRGLEAEIERLSSTLVTNRDMANAEAICERILADEKPFSPVDWRHDIAQTIANGRRALEPKP